MAPRYRRRHQHGRLGRQGPGAFLAAFHGRMAHDRLNSVAHLLCPDLQPAAMLLSKALLAAAAAALLLLAGGGAADTCYRADQQVVRTPSPATGPRLGVRAAV